MLGQKDLIGLSLTQRRIGENHRSMKAVSVFSNVRYFCLLFRMNSPVGISLLFFPCLWGLAIAKPQTFPLREGVLFLAGSLLMRSAGCVYNDMVDKKIDCHVRRTTHRPLVSGVLSTKQAAASLVLLLLPSVAILLQFNTLTFLLGLVSVGLVLVYPWTKRLTDWPQFFLGLTFNWGILLGWTSVHGSLSYEPVILYSSGILWTIGYDTLYAFQDVEDDLKIGVRSTAIHFNRESKTFLVSLFTGMCLIILFLGISLQTEPLFYVGMILLGSVLYSQVFLLNINDKEELLSLFRFNGWVGLAVLSCLLLI